MAGPQHLPERPWEGARLFPRKDWVGASYPFALPGCLSNPPGCTLSISETLTPAHSQLSHVPCKVFSLYKSSLSCACLPFPALCCWLQHKGYPAVTAPACSLPVKARPAGVPRLPLAPGSSAGTEQRRLQLSGLRSHTQI